jgi:hypothetical protein
MLRVAQGPVEIDDGVKGAAVADLAVCRTGVYRTVG